MRRAVELEPGDVTPHCVVGDWVVAAEWAPYLGSHAEIAIREDGVAEDGPRTLMYRDALVEVLGCVDCGEKHEVGDCPRRSLADPDHPDEVLRGAARMAIRPGGLEKKHPVIMRHVRVVEEKRARSRGEG